MTDVAELVVAAVVDATNFVTASETSSEAFKIASLLKSLEVSALIKGERGVGKRTLASFILPNAEVLDASEHGYILTQLESVNELIILNLDRSPNINQLTQTIENSGARVIATAGNSFNGEYVNDIFSVKFDIPPLSQRKEDIEELIDLFVVEAQEIFGCKNNFDRKSFVPDLSSNAKSLKRQVMIHVLLQDISDNELMQILQSYLYDKLGSNSDYRKFLYLYEVPLIKAGLDRYKSQLQLAEKLGLNRNTLRKKIAENNLQGEK